MGVWLTLLIALWADGALLAQQLPMHAARQAADDLELSGDLAGASPSPHYVRYSELAALPQVTKTVDGGPDFGGLKLTVTGVYLEELAKLVAPAADLADAWCTDKYRSYFPAEYMARHHPILVLRVDGMLPAEWAAKNHQDDPGPYFVIYADFVPAFQVLSHRDEAQLPANVVRLHFGSAEKTFAAIAPAERFRDDAAVAAGFTIVKQNCLRCHFRGDVGGTKSGQDWMKLSAWSRSLPQQFSAYVRDPRSVDPKAKMPGNPQYDEATRAALAAYFRTFTEPEVAR
jgi:mono/diheme cytochrome c family protein